MGQLSLRNVFVRGLTKANRITLPPVADFTADVVSGIAPLTVNFTDTSTNTPTSWAWDFNNDGTTDSTSQNPSHTYNSAGTYTVKLTATNDDGSDEVIKTGLITVVEQVYTLSRSVSSVDEGSSVTITLNTEYVQPGTVVPYTISGTGITSSDIGGASLTGNFTIQGTLQSGSATLTLAVSQDSLTEGAETLTLSIATPSRSISVVINDTSLSVAAPGATMFTTPGTYTFTVPDGVTSISAVLVGGGGSGAWRGVYGNSGAGGGGLRYINDLPVTPGQQWTVIVGSGGVITNPPTSPNYQPGPNGGTSLIRRASDTEVAVQATGGGGAMIYTASSLRGQNTGFGGGGTSIGPGPLGGTIGGGNGGNGGASYGSSNIPGSGGAGGYAGNGGDGGNFTSTGTFTLSTAGAGGGGGGSAAWVSSGGSGHGGGGVGLYGQGANGSAGISTSRPGGGGSGGNSGQSVESLGSSGPFAPTGGLYGGGGGSTSSSATINADKVVELGGGNGAVRIIWGPGRSFPSNAA